MVDIYPEIYAWVHMFHLPKTIWILNNWTLHQQPRQLCTLNIISNYPTVRSIFNCNGLQRITLFHLRMYIYMGIYTHIWWVLLIVPLIIWGVYITNFDYLNCLNEKWLKIGQLYEFLFYPFISGLKNINYRTSKDCFCFCISTFFEQYICLLDS